LNLRILGSEDAEVALQPEELRFAPNGSDENIEPLPTTAHSRNAHSTNYFQVM
jgi:hypothetical protein